MNLIIGFIDVIIVLFISFWAIVGLLVLVGTKTGQYILLILAIIIGITIYNVHQDGNKQAKCVQVAEIKYPATEITSINSNTQYELNQEKAQDNYIASCTQ